MNQARYRIALVCSEYPPVTGGIGRYCCEIAKGLSRNGYEVHVATKRPAGNAQLESDEDSGGFSVVRRERGIQSKATRRWLDKLQPDMVIAGDLVGLVESWRWSWMRRCPLVAIGHGSEFQSVRLSRRIYKRWIYNRCNMIIANSAYTQQWIVKAGIRRPKIAIVFPGADDAVHQPNHPYHDLEVRWGLTGRDVMVTIGTLSERKGQASVIRALPQLRKRFKNIHYLAIGRDRLDGALTALAESLGVSEHFTAVGPIPEHEKSAWLNMSRFAILPSVQLPHETEGFGIAVIEAALTGRTTIGTYGTGVQEAILNGETGLLVNQNDPSDLAEAATRLLEDSSYRIKLEKAAYERATTMTWTHQINAIHGHIRALLQT